MKVTEVSKNTEQFFNGVYPEIWSKYQEGDLLATSQVEMFNLANEIRGDDLNKIISDKMNLEVLISLIASKQDISKYIDAAARKQCRGDHDVYEEIKTQLNSNRWVISDIEID